MRRRDFLKTGFLAAGICAASRMQADEAAPRSRESGGTAQPPIPIQERVCLFTDHLDDFDFSYAEVARMLREVGVAGPDLTVRPGGLVKPERVAEDLPQAVTAFRDEGLSVPMLTTGITSAADPVSRQILEAMSRLKIGYYKLGYFPYDDLAEWPQRIAAVRGEVARLAELGQKLGVRAAFHNHAGPFVGGALWDSWEVLEPLGPEAVGFYYDPAQATIEGGKHAWKLNFRRIAPRLVMVAVKDFVWEKVDGRWQTRWCPLGEGMVDWPEFFRLLAAVPFDGPVSLHIEYDPGGATRTARYDNSLEAAARDLRFLRRHLEEAFGNNAAKPDAR